uniref:60S ribosomal export protein NMD3 n=1 Tax=Chenopodium quinoa TaxID=63459 RepID=A0A803KRQ7_CHEQI
MSFTCVHSCTWGLIVKHQVAISAVKLKRVEHGLDFFFAKKRDAVKFLDFLCSVVSIKPQNKSLKQLMSQDTKSNIS